MLHLSIPYFCFKWHFSVSASFIRKLFCKCNEKKVIFKSFSALQISKGFLHEKKSSREPRNEATSRPEEASWCHYQWSFCITSNHRKGRWLEFSDFAKFGDRHGEESISSISWFSQKGKNTIAAHHSLYIQCWVTRFNWALLTNCKSIRYSLFCESCMKAGTSEKEPSIFKKEIVEFQFKFLAEASD